MPVTPDKPAPYAPVKTVLSVIERHREKGLPRPIDGAVLGRAGVPETLLPRVLQSLAALDLIDDDRNPTPTFESLRLASADEYQKRLAEWLQSTYSQIFQFVDPAKDGEARIRDAFRGFQPIGQQDRMVALFVGLCVTAGLMPEKAQSISPRQAPTYARPRLMNGPKSKPKTKVFAGGDAPQNMPLGSTGLPPALAGLLASLPVNGKGWSQGQRDKFLTTFEAVIDFVIPIKVEGEDEDNEGDAD